jgi:RNA recognition motif-containing protein
MSKNIYVGNLPYETGERELRELFEPHGEVLSVNVIEDRETGRSRGFAFVEMDEQGADAAIRALAGTMLGNRSLNINEARPRAESSRPRRQRW